MTSREGRQKRARAGVAVVAVLALSAGGFLSPVEAGEKQTVDCAHLRNAVHSTLRANLRVTEHGAKCVITGTVKGNVRVVDHSTICDPPPAGMGQEASELTAVNVIGGVVEGNITSVGGRCAMIWLRHGTVVLGDVSHGAAGNLGFLDLPVTRHPGSTVRGNVELAEGKLFASSVSEENRVLGRIRCSGGSPASGRGTARDWDGDGDTDGRVGRSYNCPVPPPLDQAQVTEAPVSWHAQSGNQGAVPNATAKLIASASGIWARIRTSYLDPTHAYTAWLVIVNNPAACAAQPCAAPDIIQNPATESQVTYGDGRVPKPDGRARFLVHAPVGPLEGWLEDRAFDDPLGAELHVVLNDHGSVMPEFMPRMIHTYRAGCTEDSLPAIFPPSARADGEPGPNKCTLFQVAIFQQQ